jgi:hypothetical protein
VDREGPRQRPVAIGTLGDLGEPIVWMCTSVPQIVVVVTRTSASSGATSRIGFPSSTIRPGSTKRAAFILVAIPHLLRYILGAHSPAPLAVRLADVLAGRIATHETGGGRVVQRPIEIDGYHVAVVG